MNSVRISIDIATGEGIRNQPTDFLPEMLRHVANMSVNYYTDSQIPHMHIALWLQY